MRPLFLSLFILFSLFSFSNSTGIVWFRLSSSQQVTARIEVLDKTNTSRYGISFDVQLLPRIQKELILPMPSSPSHFPIPIFDYSIQMLNHVSGSRIGEKSGQQVPLLANYTWIHSTVSQEDITIATSIRFECLPQFFGFKCQFFCPFGDQCDAANKTEVDEKYTSYYEKKEQIMSSSRPLILPGDFLLFFIIISFIFLIVILLIVIRIITRSSAHKREICEPEIGDETFSAYNFTV